MNLDIALSRSFWRGRMGLQLWWM